MRSRTFLLWATAIFLFTGGPSTAGGMMGDLSGSALPGAGSFTPLQRGFGGAPPGPWQPGAQDFRGRPERGFLPRDPRQRRNGWRRRPHDYGVGLIYPYADDYGEEIFEEEPIPPMPEPPPAPPAPPKPRLGPKTVSAPPATAASEASSTGGGSIACGKGRKVTLGEGRPNAFGCISP
jgi:hypothetical protein